MNNTKRNEIYQAASLMLEVARDEYTKERERVVNLDNKSGLFISGIITIITIYLTIIPFNQFKVIYSQNSKSNIILATIFIFLLVIASCFLILSLICFVKTIADKPYNRVSLEYINDEEYNKIPIDQAARGLNEHFYHILTKNAEINDKKAVSYHKGIILIALCFLPLSIGTIGLLIII